MIMTMIILTMILTIIILTMIMIMMLRQWRCSHHGAERRPPSPTPKIAPAVSAAHMEQQIISSWWCDDDFYGDYVVDYDDFDDYYDDDYDDDYYDGDFDSPLLSIRSYHRDADEYGNDDDNDDLKEGKAMDNWTYSQILI